MLRSLRGPANETREFVNCPKELSAKPAITPVELFGRLVEGVCDPYSVSGRSAYFFSPALIFAHRARCAAAILLRPAAEMVRFLRLAAQFIL
jgi:hypothetical protein